LGEKFKALFEEVSTIEHEQGLCSEQEAIDTVTFYKANKDTECYYREEGGRWLVYRKG